mmetsp:Transcript_56419/g.155891  ORF Transcript_56419/g.155891 Transcript_56419/m.155891 type:complete len:204 (+) Transcript_56419:806-1417(+)
MVNISTAGRIAQDTARIEGPAVGRDSNADRSFGDEILLEGLLVAVLRQQTVAINGGGRGAVLVVSTSPILPSVRVVHASLDPRTEQVLERERLDRTLAPAGAAAVVRVGGTVDNLLLGQDGRVEEAAVAVDEKLRLDRTDRGKSPAVATSLVLDWSDHVGVAPIELGRGVHVKRLELFAKGSFQGLAFPHSGQHPEVGSAQLL